MKKYMAFETRDGTWWGIPTDLVARNRADFFKDEFGGDLERSLAEDTLPLFEESEYEISDWAAGNMDYSDFSSSLVKLEVPKPPILTALDYNRALMSSKKRFCDE